MTTLPQLIGLLQTIKVDNKPIPLAHFQFLKAQTPPFLIYVDTDINPFNADNENFYEFINVDIELYTATTRNRALENQIKALLNGADIPFEFSSVFIESTKQWKSTYEVSLI